MGCCTMQTQSCTPRGECRENLFDTLVRLTHVLCSFLCRFHATEYLYPMTIIGRGGQKLEDLWKKEGARAYLGCMVPGFPNLFSVYGPNTNGLVSCSGEVTRVEGRRKGMGKGSPPFLLRMPCLQERSLT